uniref:Uncharacterized protein n=1 Tax=Cacopsylla melanoneura TaxID=428564 RepID=A0A8D8ZWT4_9HEMI
MDPPYLNNVANTARNNDRMDPPYLNKVANTATNNDRIEPHRTDNTVSPHTINQSPSSSNRRRISFKAQLENVRVFDSEMAASEISEWTPNQRNGNTSPVEYNTTNENARISESRHHNIQSPSSPANFGPRNSGSQNDNVVAANLVSQIDSKYRHLNTSEKLAFIHKFFYMCPLVRNQFDLILELCHKKGDRVLLALFEIVLNKVIDCESKGNGNDMMKAILENQLRLLTKIGIDELIKTPVICEDKWSPLRIWCFVCQYQTIDDAVKVLERYFLLEEDRRLWALSYDESDLTPFCYVVTNLLRAYSREEDADRVLMIHLCCLLLALYKNSPQNSSPDFPRVLECSVLTLLDSYLFTFYKSLKPKPAHVSDDDLDYYSEDERQRHDEENVDPERERESACYREEFRDLGLKLPALMDNLLDVAPELCSASYCKSFIRACVMYFVRSSVSDRVINIDHAIELMKTVPHIYTFHEEGNVIVLKDIYSEEEIFAMLSYAFHNIANSPSLVQAIKRNTTIVMIHLEQTSQIRVHVGPQHSSQSIHGSSLVNSLRHYLPNHLKMHNRTPMMRVKKVLKSRLLGKMAHLELSDEQPEDSDSWLHLDNLSVIAHIHAIQNKELLKPPLPNTYHEQNHLG